MGRPPRAGLQIGDVITSVGKQKVAKLEQIVNVFRAAMPGVKITVKVMRGKETKEFAVVVLPRTPARADPALRLLVRRPARERAGPAGAGRLPVRRRLPAPPTAARPGRASTASIHGRCTSARFASIPATTRFIYVLGIRLYRSDDGGKTFQMSGDSGVHPDQHALWIDPRDGRHMLIGTRRRLLRQLRPRVTTGTS